MEKFILLGASRGLGWETYLQLRQKNSENYFLLSSRKIELREPEIDNQTLLVGQDFSAPVDTAFMLRLQEFAPTTLIYFAGGGPYGLFQSKKWSDHQWGLQTTFLYPAELTHSLMREKSRFAALRKIVLIGSSVAEAKADPLAGSYAAAKHALRGLVDSVNSEQKSEVKLLLFSPGYMQTDLLPSNSKPRQNSLAESPQVVAAKLIDYIENN